MPFKILSKVKVDEEVLSFLVITPHMKAMYDQFSDICYIHEEDCPLRSVFSFYGRDRSYRLVKFGLLINKKHN